MLEKLFALFGMFMLSSITYFFYNYPIAHFYTKLSYEQQCMYNEYFAELRNTWFSSLIIGLLFSGIIFLVLNNKKILVN